MSVTTMTNPAGSPRAQPSIDLRGETTSLRTLAREMWNGRELLVILARKDFHVRYRRASFGVLWALALPLIQALVMAVVFSRVAHIGGLPHVSYTLFVLSGMAPWAYFNMALTAGSTAVVDNSTLSSKVYFPRAVLPLTQVVNSLYAFVVTLAIVLALCPVLHASLGPATLLVVPGALLLIALTSGFVLVHSALHVYFRDVKYLVSAAMLMWLYVTPILYPPAAAPGPLRAVINVNPMTGVVDIFRAATVGHVGALGAPVAISIAWMAGLLVVGTALQCRFNRVFADLM